MKTIRIIAWAICMCLASWTQAQTSELVTAYQYYYDTDPGVGVAGNGAIVSIPPTDNLNQTLSINLPGSLSSGFHRLYLRVRDEYGRWSVTERRMFYIVTLPEMTDNTVAYQYYFDTDPGVGVTGNGAIVAVTPAADFNQTVAIPLTGALTDGFHRLYIRVKDEHGRWSTLERRMFYILNELELTDQIVAYQYHFDTDPGVGNAGNGGIVPVTPTADLNQTIAIPLTGALTDGFHRLYIRVKDEHGRWSTIERRMFYIKGQTEITDQVVAYQYYFDADPGVGVPGNGAVIPITPTADFDQTVMISIPNTLASGFHRLYIRMKDEQGRWSMIERRMFYIHDMPSKTEDIVQLEYYYDTDPGVGNANSYPVTPTGDYEETVDLGVPCLTTGTHYFYLRAKDSYGRWSIIERDTLEITSGIAASDVTPAGPLSICIGDEVELSTVPVPGVSYQWVESGDLIAGETSPTLTVTAGGDYALQAYCGSSFVLSNTVTVTELTLITYYADSDTDGYGDATSTLMDCVQPAGYVTNDDDCDDGDVSIHPGAVELCNLIDDDCDGTIDEGVQSTFYADTDVDGYGDPLVTTLACSAPAGYVSNDDDCDDENPDINPNATEVCNLIDDDCDGMIDEGVQTTFYADVDNDGFGDLSATQLACTQPSGYVLNGDDCNDGNAGIHPGAPELCNGVDEDCDTEIDEGFVYSLPATSISSSGGTHFCSGTNTLLSVVDGTLGSGAVWKWYEDGCGSGSSIGTGSSISVTPTGGVHTYYVRAEGTCNTSACTSLTIIVDTAPSFTACPVNSIVSMDATLCSATRSYTVVSSGSPSPTLTYSFSGATTGSVTGTGSGSLFNKGTTTVTVTADNLCGSAICSFSITVNDTEDPVITGCPSAINAIVEEGQWGAHVTWTEPTATDNCAMESLTSSHSPGSFFNVGTTTVTYTAEDESGNASVCQFYITITPPVIQSQVNLSIYSNDILFSNNNPDPGTAVNVSAVVHNYSSVDAADFIVRLDEMFSNITYPSVTIPSLGANQSTQVNWVIPMPAVAAFVPISVTVDLMDDLDESNEADNVAIKPIICGTPESLGTMGVGTNPVPASVPAGSYIQLCGSAFYENVTPPLDDPSVAGAEITITIVETGQVISGYTDENGNFCISYLTPITPGTYHYTVEVTDNTLGGDASGTFVLTTPPPPPCLKDLAVSIQLTGLPFVYYGLPVGTTFSGTVRIQNNCQAVSEPTTLYMNFTVGMPVPGPFVVPALSSGEVYEIELPLMTLTTTGSGYLSATTDYYNVVVEANETNNTAFKTFNVLPLLPDLSVIGADVLSGAFCQSGNQVSFVVKNYGYSASGSYNAVFEFYENEILQATETRILPSLDPEEDTIVLFSFTPSILLDSFVLTVDMPDVIAELNEENNTLVFNYQFAPCQADIIILGCEYFDVKPAGVQPMDVIQVSAMIKNQGQLPVASPFEVEFNIAGAIVTVPVNTSLAPMQVIELVTSGTAPPAPGDNISATADAGNLITEANESNNSYTTALCYDIEFTNINCFGDPIFSATQYYCNTGVFRVGLWNYGVFEADNLQVKFEISGPGLSGWVHLGTVSKYMGNSCDCPDGVELPNTFFSPQTGLYDVRITLDPDNVYMECDESDNVFLATVNVVESADYKVLSSFIAPSNLNPDIDEVVSFAVTYTNDGCTGFNQIELFTSVDEAPLDSLLVSPLSGGGFNTVAIPNTWSSSVPGIHVFRAVIDHDELIGEGDELNNEATKAIIVGEAPDYRVMTIASTDMSPDMGELITIETDVHNDGQSTGTGTLQFLYVEGNAQEVMIEQQQISLLPGTTENYAVLWIAVAPYAKVIARIINVSPLESDYSDNEMELQLTPMSILITDVDVDCAGLDLGSLEVDISGGQAPYVIQWSTGQSDPFIYVPSGTYSVTITDALGTTAIAFDTILDQAIPTTYYKDADGDSFGNPDSTLYVCDPPEDYVGTGTDCDDTDAIVYPDAPEVADAQDNDCDGSVDEGLSFLSVDAGDCETVYLGYAPAACYDLTVLAEGGALPYTYLWSNGATTPTTTVCPEQTTIYTIVVTDNNGFTAQDVVTVQVIDIRCGNNNDKVLVCHIPPGNPENVQMICISQNAVAAHLAEHGDYIGICDAPDPCSEEGQSYGDIQIDEVHADEDHHEVSYDETAQDDPLSQLMLVPNPADHFVMVKLPDIESGYEVCMFDITGKLIQKHKYAGGGLRISTEGLANGMYMIQFRSPERRMAKALVILH